ncbi:MAG: peptidoglycan-binding protein [Terriglobia bacterium]
MGTGFTADGTSGSVSVSPTETTTYEVNCSGATDSATVGATSQASNNPLHVEITGDFSQTNTCTSVLSPGQDCAISVTFTPTQFGTRTGTLSFLDPVSNATDTVPLSGGLSGFSGVGTTNISMSTQGSDALTASAFFSGIGNFFGGIWNDIAGIFGRGSETAAVALSISPNSLDFGSVAVGQSSEVQIVTLTDPASAATATLTANPTSITSGGSSTLAWSSTNATSCTGTGFTASGTSGSVSVSPTETTTYAVNCSGATASSMVTVSAVSSGGGGGGSSSGGSSSSGSSSGSSPVGTTLPKTPSAPHLTRYLYHGVTGSDVLVLQNYLIALGLMPGDDNTGYYGEVTEGAVQKLQCKLTVICSGDTASTGWGVVGPETIKMLTGASVGPTPVPASTGSTAIFPGEEGSIVKTLQNILITNGYMPADDNTGYYGEVTEDAIAKFQCLANIVCSGDPVTTGYGQAGPKTREALGM